MHHSTVKVKMMRERDVREGVANSEALTWADEGFPGAPNPPYNNINLNRNSLLLDRSLRKKKENRDPRKPVYEDQIFNKAQEIGKNYECVDASVVAVLGPIGVTPAASPIEEEEEEDDEDDDDNKLPPSMTAMAGMKVGKLDPNLAEKPNLDYYEQEKEARRILMMGSHSAAVPGLPNNTSNEASSSIAKGYGDGRGNYNPVTFASQTLLQKFHQVPLQPVLHKNNIHNSLNTINTSKSIVPSSQTSNLMIQPTQNIVQKNQMIQPQNIVVQKVQNLNFVPLNNNINKNNIKAGPVTETQDESGSSAVDLDWEESTNSSGRRGDKFNHIDYYQKKNSNNIKLKKNYHNNLYEDATSVISTTIENENSSSSGLVDNLNVNQFSFYPEENERIPVNIRMAGDAHSPDENASLNASLTQRHSHSHSQSTTTNRANNSISKFRNINSKTLNNNNNNFNNSPPKHPDYPDLPKNPARIIKNNAQSQNSKNHIVVTQVVDSDDDDDGDLGAPDYDSPRKPFEEDYEDGTMPREAKQALIRKAKQKEAMGNQNQNNHRNSNSINGTAPTNGPPPSRTQTQTTDPKKKARATTWKQKPIAAPSATEILAQLKQARGGR